MKKITQALAVAVASAGLVLVPSTSAEAKAQKVGEAYVDHPTPKRVYLAMWEKKRNKKGQRILRVQFSDMSVYRFTPCKYEDSRNCYWAAEFMGNKKGRSYVDLHGKARMIPNKMLRAHWKYEYVGN